MTNEQSFFVQILSDHLNGRKTEARPGLDWDALLAYANSHQVSGILYHQCAAFLPEAQKARAAERHAAELYYYFNREALLAQLSDALSKAEIPFFTVKGIDVAKLYPIPPLRTMGDCDVVVDPEDQARAHPLLLALGMKLIKKDSAEWVYLKNGIEFELHHHLLYEDSANTSAERALCDAAWNDTEPTGQGTRYALNWSFHFLFLLLHLKKHLIHSGVGFRQFMDLAVVLQKRELDWLWLEAQLRELELLDFAKVCLALLERWFAITPPIDAAELDESFCEHAIEQICSNGVFGFENEENGDNARMHEISAQGGSRLASRVRYLLQVFFPPYRHLRAVPYYSFLDGRPWLLPIAWLYRVWYKCTHNRRKQGEQMLKAAFLSGEKLDARERELAKWGL